MDNSPALLVLLTALACYVAWLGLQDIRTADGGQPNPRALPGATRAPATAYVIGILGALFLLVIETVGESWLGLSGQQSRMTWLFAVYTLAAAIIEEVVFRGYLVIDKQGRVALSLGIVGASLLFAALHPFLWRWDAQGFAWTLNAKGMFSTAMVFSTSLWLYVTRFARWNPEQSLLPCIAAHAAKNAGVIAIKATLGFMGALW